MKKIITLGELMLRLAPEGYYRFVQATTLGATFGGGEANVAVSLSNFGMHAAAVVLIYVFTRVTIFSSQLAAFFGALLFAVHPVHIESVVTLYGRADILCAANLAVVYTYDLIADSQP